MAMEDEYKTDEDAYEMTPLEKLEELLADYKNTLPDACYSASQETNEVIIIKRGERGFYKTDWGVMKDYDTALLIAKRKNERLEITPEQYDAMVLGSMRGFNSLRGLDYSPGETDNAEQDEVQTLTMK